MHKLSKSTYMGGLQCLKKLYLNKHFRELKSPINAEQQFIFDQGTKTGELAQLVFPGGEDCTPKSYYDFEPSIKRTGDLIEQRFPVIYEAAFVHDGVLAALDILVLKDDGWHGFEVKSTTRTKPEHIEDSALQYWVMNNNGLELATMNLMHFDGEYTKRGEVEPHELFTHDDITRQVQKLQDEVPGRIALFKKTLSQSQVPDIRIGQHCKLPYECDFKEYCWKDVPKYSVINLNRGGKKSWDMYHSGIVDIKDIPDNVELTSAQRVQVNAEKRGEAISDIRGINDFLSSLKYPLYFLDFETIASGIPIYDESRPHQKICFQYSLHIQMSPGAESRHYEFLADPKEGDPRIPMLRKLQKELGTEGSIIVYHQSFEDGRLVEMMRDCPGFEQSIQNWRSRIVDLEDPFRLKHYYTKEMKGKSSIKYVLPALMPELSYDNLDVQEGGTASRVFLEMVLGQFEGDVEATRKALLEYCKLDTLAMVRILEVLLSFIN